MGRKVFSLGVVVVSCLLLAGPACFSLGKNGPPTKFYMLSATTPSDAKVGEGGQMAPAFIGVGPIRIPSYVDRPQIVSRGAGYEMEIADFASWAEPLKDSFGRVLAESLARDLKTKSIVLFPWASEVPVDHQVQLEVIRFDGTLGKTVVLDVGWMIYGRPRKGLLVNKHSMIYTDTQGPDYGALVQAMSETIQKLSSEIASEITMLQ
jgi:uncharacterized lipoprotein YmbA